jgi:hypothetical protein
VIKDLYDFWLQKNNEKLDILEECELMVQLFEKFNSKENGLPENGHAENGHAENGHAENGHPENGHLATTRWNIKKPRSKKLPKTNTVSVKKESGKAPRLLGGVRRMGESLSSTESPLGSKELTNDEKERLRIFTMRTKNSRDKANKGEVGDRDDRALGRLTRSTNQSEAESVDIKVYINDLKYRILTVQSTHSKSDLCQLAIQSFKLEQSYQYTISLWRDFKQNLEIKESGEATPFKLYFKEVANDSSKLFHIHRVKPVKSGVTQRGAVLRSSQTNMENYKIPEGVNLVPFESPKREIHKKEIVGYCINSFSKQSPPSLIKIRAINNRNIPNLFSSPAAPPLDKSDSKNNLSLKNSTKPPLSKQVNPSRQFLPRTRNTARPQDLSPSQSNTNN